MFKVGDKVRCLDTTAGAAGLVEGKIYEVARVERDGPVLRGLEHHSWWFPYRFELVTDDPSPVAFVLPQTDADRKAAPMYRGLLGYFPGALFHVARHSMLSDQKHNPDRPGGPTWARGKSSDHDDCVIRHTAEQHVDPLYHKTARAWRALADLQEYLEREHGYAPGAHSRDE